MAVSTEWRCKHAMDSDNPSSILEACRQGRLIGLIPNHKSCGPVLVVDAEPCENSDNGNCVTCEGSGIHYEDHHIAGIPAEPLGCLDCRATGKCGCGSCVGGVVPVNGSIESWDGCSECDSQSTGGPVLVVRLGEGAE